MSQHTSVSILRPVPDSSLPGRKVEREQREVKHGAEADCEVKTVDVRRETLTAKNRTRVCAVKGLESLESAP